ncbi:hypothetical protein FH972_010354 [Carpinus fangiana]|uniref:Uncharacterized protein n=1 Tax=Carpinus fangiana TaxID=176857 RepID=A0A660KR68_9ROSI|nr:hypothetical protein FH972_010354 [Carpinus fangiana]
MQSLKFGIEGLDGVCEGTVHGRWYYSRMRYCSWSTVHGPRWRDLAEKNKEDETLRDSQEKKHKRKKRKKKEEPIEGISEEVLDLVPFRMGMFPVRTGSQIF